MKYKFIEIANNFVNLQELNLVIFRDLLHIQWKIWESHFLLYIEIGIACNYYIKVQYNSQYTNLFLISILYFTIYRNFKYLKEDILDELLLLKYYYIQYILVFTISGI